MNRKTYYSLMLMIFSSVRAYQISIEIAVEPKASMSNLHCFGI
jgi:hypothetical protein